MKRIKDSIYKEKDLISVIIPIYNVDQYLCRCVDSVLNQTYPNIEIILVDDGSTDTCGKICDDYAKQYRNIKVIHQENKGLGAARNSGIDIATGDYIGFVDSDDYISEDMYEKLHQACVEHDCKISSCDLLRKLIDGKERCRQLESGIYTAEDVFYKILVENKIEYSSCNKLFSKEVIGIHRYKENVKSEDVVFVTNCVDRSGKLYHVGGDTISIVREIIH